MRQAGTPGPRPRIWSIVLSALLLIVLWSILTEGSVGAFWFGLPVMVAAAAAGSALSTGSAIPRVRPVAFARFGVYFLACSLRGGIDVALRAFRPALPLAPGLLAFPLRLPPGAARIFFANATSLMPGTLSAELEPGCLRVHALDRNAPLEAQLRVLETRIADAFGVVIGDRQSEETTA